MHEPTFTFYCPCCQRTVAFFRHLGELRGHALACCPACHGTHLRGGNGEVIELRPIGAPWRVDRQQQQPASLGQFGLLQAETVS